MLKPILFSAGAGLVSGLFFLSLVTGSIGAVIFTLMASLPLFAAALALAVPGATIAGAAGTLLVGLIGGVETALGYLMMVAGPPGLIGWLVLRKRPDGAGGTAWFPPGLTLVWLAGYGIAVFAVMLLLTGGVDGGLMTLLRDQLARMLTAMAAGQVPMGDLSSMIDLFVMILPGTALAGWTLILIANAALAQGALARFGWALRPGMRMRDIDLPMGMHVALAGAIGAAAMLGGQLQFAALTAAIILSVPFFLVGVSIVHVLAGRMRSGWLFLTLFYVLLLITNAWFLAVVVVFGFIEHWVGARRRLSRS